MIQPWTQLDSVALGDFKVFRLRKDLKRSPRTGLPHEFYVLETVDWVNVVALTPDDQVVLVEQYRHGTGTVELEIPGGLMDAGDSSPIDTALRELREETGYTGRRARIIGEVLPNPAIQNNRTYTVLVEDCQKTHAVELDQGEDIVTHLVPIAHLAQMVASGRIRHCIVVAALYHFELWRQGLHRLHAPASTREAGSSTA
ncbi:MAG: NUDIX hydrolase [Verrucomicrobiota bacterium]|nr:NUDIX hydrolase [Limisphaera sp.]MDW8380964.1 NUDIX hydrolase [Verrucomicrobiota bacterium]